MTNAQPTPNEPLATWLPTLIEELIDAHTAWLDAITEQRTAISRAEPAAVEIALRRQDRAQLRVATLDAKRRDRIGDNGITLTAIAKTLDEPIQRRALGRAEELKSLAKTIQREQSVVRTASASLLAHMRGVMSQVASALNHAGTYARGGQMDAGPVVVSSLDIRQ
ncbi:MAG: hypothetical protein AAF235_10690 [Planctomycetota bacterium]